MTEYERMEAGLLYDCADEEIMAEQTPFQDKLWEFNRLKPTDYAKKQAYMKEVFAECGENCYIELPLRANWGGRHFHFGSGIYANANLTAVDDGHIYVGDRVRRDYPSGGDDREECGHRRRERRDEGHSG